MKELIVRHCPGFDYLQDKHWEAVSVHKIDTINWSTFPYCPSVQFKIVHNSQTLFIRYDVDELYPVRAINTQDQDPVYQDSCVEFFFLDDNDYYHNFECNAIGAMLSAYGKHRKNRTSRSPEEMQQIIRQPSVIEEKQGHFCWSVVVGIPFAILGIARYGRYRANFYKCGDKTEKIHYLSWNKIDLEQPNFHCSEYFGLIKIE